MYPNNVVGPDAWVVNKHERHALVDIQKLQGFTGTLEHKIADKCEGL